MYTRCTVVYQKVGGSVHPKEGGVHQNVYISAPGRGGWGECTEEGGGTCASVCQKKGLGVHQERQAGRGKEKSVKKIE